MGTGGLVASQFGRRSQDGGRVAGSAGHNLCQRRGPGSAAGAQKRSERKEDGGVSCRSWPLLVMEAGARHLHVALEELPFSLGGHTAGMSWDAKRPDLEGCVQGKQQQEPRLRGWPEPRMLT